MAGHYFGTVERWDRGHWDVAHWDGQIGITNTVAAITINGNPVGVREAHVLTAQTVAIQVQGIPVICRAGRGLRAQLGNIVLTGFDTGAHLQWHLSADPPLDANSGMVEVTGIWAELKPFLGAGDLNFGIPLKVGNLW